MRIIQALKAAWKAYNRTPFENNALFWRRIWSCPVCRQNTCICPKFGGFKHTPEGSLEGFFEPEHIARMKAVWETEANEDALVAAVTGGGK